MNISEANAWYNVLTYLNRTRPHHPNDDELDALAYLCDRASKALGAGKKGDQATRDLQAKPEPVECRRCLGCGRIADSEEGEPWSMWLDLPLKSAAAVTLGVVRPIDCPDCGGTGQVQP